jgi:hypothetical protein
VRGDQRELALARRRAHGRDHRGVQLVDAGERAVRESRARDPR